MLWSTPHDFYPSARGETSRVIGIRVQLRVPGPAASRLSLRRYKLTLDGWIRRNRWARLTWHSSHRRTGNRQRLQRGRGTSAEKQGITIKMLSGIATRGLPYACHLSISINKDFTPTNLQPFNQKGRMQQSDPQHEQFPTVTPFVTSEPLLLPPLPSKSIPPKITFNLRDFFK